MKGKIYEHDLTGRIASFQVDLVGKDQGVPCTRIRRVNRFGEQARHLLWLEDGMYGYKCLLLRLIISQHLSCPCSNLSRHLGAACLGQLHIRRGPLWPGHIALLGLHFWRLPKSFPHTGGTEHWCGRVHPTQSS